MHRWSRPLTGAQTHFCTSRLDGESFPLRLLLTCAALAVWLQKSEHVSVVLV